MTILLENAAGESYCLTGSAHYNAIAMRSVCDMYEGESHEQQEQAKQRKVDDLILNMQKSVVCCKGASQLRALGASLRKQNLTNQNLDLLKSLNEASGENCSQTQSTISKLQKQSDVLTKRIKQVNSISLIVNLLLTFAALYYSLPSASSSSSSASKTTPTEQTPKQPKSHSSALSAFAADCALDAISSAIVLWRFSGDLTSVYLFAREQIACIYLGALFEMSALGIALEASGSLMSGLNGEEAGLDTKTAKFVLSSNDSLHNIALDYSNSVKISRAMKTTAGDSALVNIAIVATIAMASLTILKAMLFRAMRDKSILLDVINCLVSTVFAGSILLLQALINAYPIFWYLDPVLSIVLAVFMALFGFKVIYENFDILKPTKGYFPCLGFDGIELSASTSSRLAQQQVENNTNANDRYHIFDSITITMPRNDSTTTLTNSTHVPLTGCSTLKMANYSSISGEKDDKMRPWMC